MDAEPIRPGNQGGIMNKLSLYNELLDIFEFKSFHDNVGNELIILKNSSSSILNGTIIEDKTAFEAVDSHIHLIDNIRRYDKQLLIEFGKKIGRLLIDRLSFSFPDKHFVVFVTITDSMIIRFHQKWENEPYYYDNENFNNNEYLISFDN